MNLQETARDRTSFIAWFILEALGHDNEMAARIVETDLQNATVKLVINGIDLDAADTLAYLGRQYEDMVDRRAVQIADERFSAEFNRLRDAVDDVIKKTYDRLDIKKEED